MGGSSHRIHAKTYVLTCDIGMRIASLRCIGLKTPDPHDQFFLDLRNELVEEIQGAHKSTGVTVRAIDMEELGMEILGKAQKMLSSIHRGLIVSSCEEIAAPRRGFTLEINRLVDYQGNFVGLGPRPGHPSLDDQIEMIKTSQRGRPLILIEDGSFTGGTLVNILSKMKDKKVDVAAVVLGFAFPEAMEKLKTVAGNTEIVTVEQIDNLFEWMPDHDFIGFAPNCGKVLGVSMNSHAFPFYGFDNASYCVPYIMPFLSVDGMGNWASIDKYSAKRISEFSLRKSRDLFGYLERLNGREITIGELLEARPKVSVPFVLGTTNFPSVTTKRAEDFLREAAVSIT